jgi:hypothetical protein
MIKLTDQQIELIDLLDGITATVDTADIRRFLEEKQVIMKLTGTPVNNGVIVAALMELNNMSSIMAELRNENIAIKDDFQKLLTALNRNTFAYSQEFDNLKRKHNIY